MNCPVCNFDPTPIPGELAPTHCGGCGTRLYGGELPYPGLRVDPDGYEEREDTSPFIVDDEFRDQWPDTDLDNLLVIKKATYHWGRGIGMEPDGYVLAELVTVEDGHEPCPECGSTERELVEKHGEALCVHVGHETCLRCEEELEDWFHC